MGMEYDSQHDAIMRLDGTICLYQDLPFYICVDQDNKGYVHLYTMEPNPMKIKKVKYTDDKFNYKPFPLGYMNKEGQAVYLARSPDRRQKQGMSRATTSIVGGNIYGHWFPSRELEECIRGMYPNMNQAIDMVLSNVAKKVAFNRTMAVEKINASSVQLKFRERIIGHKHKSASAFSLFDSPEASFLHRYLPKYGVPL